MKNRAEISVIMKRKENDCEVKASSFQIENASENNIIKVQKAQAPKKDKIFKCQKCTKTYHRENYFEKHMGFTHGENFGNREKNKDENTNCEMKERKRKYNINKVEKSKEKFDVDNKLSNMKHKRVYSNCIGCKREKPAFPFLIAFQKFFDIWENALDKPCLKSICSRCFIHLDRLNQDSKGEGSCKNDSNSETEDIERGIDRLLHVKTLPNKKIKHKFQLFQ